MGMRTRVAAMLVLLGVGAGRMWAAPAVSAKAGEAVTVVDDGPTWTLSNGYLTVKVDKTTADLVSVKTTGTVTPGVELMGFVSGHHAGYWEQSPALAARREARVTIDPATDGGDRAEVSVKGWSDGRSILGGRPAGAGQGGGLIADLEIRYSLGRGENGLYTYAVFTHEPTYPAGGVGESRFGFKLSGKVFDWLSVDEQRNALMPTGKDWDAGDDLNMKEARRLTTGVYRGRAEHKYDYSVDQFKAPAFGWSSTKEKVGLYVINPSMEYLSSGPLHFELTGHIDDGDGGDPTLLDYWRGTHYGGSVLDFAANEPWTKVVGPIFIYVPTGAGPEALFADAKKQAAVEASRWPYGWVKGVDYTPAAERATVTGRLKLVDEQMASTKFTSLLVGLAYPDEPEVVRPPQVRVVEAVPQGEVAPEAAAPVQLNAQGKPMNRGTHVDAPRPGARTFVFLPQAVNWQNDAKHYEFWVYGKADGSFVIPKVRPGRYQLHAVADGVLGAYDGTGTVTIAAGQRVELGTIEWRPVHYGKVVWTIGTPNRSAKEFRMGNDHWHWGLYMEYSSLFPKDVDYTVGKSDPARDWFIYHVPHVVTPDPTAKAPGRATPWTIHFVMPKGQELTGKATLRFGLAGVSTRSLGVTVNGTDTGGVTGFRGGSVINRDGVEGTWSEKDLSFDAALLKPGENTIVLTVPAGGLTSGICYDVVRLEVAAGAR